MDSVKIMRAVSFLESWLAYRARHIDIPGFSVAILIDDEIVFSKAYGVADTDQQTPLTTGHLFNVASQTKMLTSVGILQLIEQGKLSFDDPAAKYLPWLADHQDARFKSMTIHHLLSHTTGIVRSQHDNDYWLFKKPFPTHAELQQIILGSSLAFNPGEGVKYSNDGFSLLGMVIEAISGKKYEDYIKTFIINPLQLDATFDLKTAVKRMPTGYGPLLLHRRQAITRRPIKSLAPTAGLYATPVAMCRFVSTFFKGNEGLLGDKQKKQMFRTQAKVRSGYNEGEEFGLGGMIQHVGERRLVGHDGHAGGHVTTTFFDQDQNIAVSVSCHSRDSEQNRILRSIFGVLDFFQSPLREESLFDVRLINTLSSVQIVQNSHKIIAIDPDDWEPFLWYETLEKVDDRTLRVVTEGSIHNFGELVQYYYKKGKLHYVKFAGITLKPDIS